MEFSHRALWESEVPLVADFKCDSPYQIKVEDN